MTSMVGLKLSQVVVVGVVEVAVAAKQIIPKHGDKETVIYYAHGYYELSISSWHSRDSCHCSTKCQLEDLKTGSVICLTIDACYLRRS